MLQDSTDRHNASRISASGITSRLSSMSPRNKLLISSAIVLSFFGAVTWVSAARQQQNNLELPVETEAGTSVQVEGVTNSTLPEVVEGESKVETKVDVRASNNSGSADTDQRVQLQVNGQQIEVPVNSEVNETITSEGLDGSVQVNVQSNLSDNADDRTRIKINSETESEVRIRNR